MYNKLQMCGAEILNDCAKIMSGWCGSHGVYNFTLEYLIKEVIATHIIGITYPVDGTCPYDAIYCGETISLKTPALALNKTRNTRTKIINPPFNYYYCGGKQLVLRNSTEDKYINYFGEVVNSVLIVVKDINSNKYGLLYYNASLWKEFYSDTITKQTSVDGGDNQWKCNLPAPATFEYFDTFNYKKDDRVMRLFDKNLKILAKQTVDETLLTSPTLDHKYGLCEKCGKKRLPYYRCCKTNIIEEIESI